MNQSIAANCRVLSVGLVILAAIAAPAAFGQPEPIERQRELFRSVIETVERGDWSVIEALPQGDIQLLQQYTLWPDLRATWEHRPSGVLVRTNMSSIMLRRSAFDALGGWDNVRFLDKARICIGGRITRTAIILLGKEECTHLLAPAQPRLTWILKDAGGVEQDYAHFDIPLPSAAKRIDLLVEDAGDGVRCDHADWVDAGFVTKEE